MCLNYRIRVLCCTPNYNCPSSTSFPTTSPTSTIIRTPTSSEIVSQTYTSTTSPTPTPTIYHPSVTSFTTPSTTACEPEVCSWSEWFDVDFPSSGPKQGDFETYQRIRAAGKQVCQHPKDIECRAEDYPEVSIQQVGQVVQCDVHFGLVCKNEDQTGKSKMCLNYRIRVLCCTLNYNCPSSTSFPTTSMTTSTATSEYCCTSTSSTPISTPCFCKIGEVIYNRTDSDGCRFYAICSPTCTIKRHVVDCYVTTPVSTTSSEWSTITTTVPLPTTSGRLPFPGCVSASYPPLQPGQRYKLSNCTELICKGDNKVEVIPTHCPPVKEITCANKYPAILVPDENGCCYHYEFQFLNSFFYINFHVNFPNVLSLPGVCSGWGDPHYITFDGTYYTFLENCTYVLVKQIVPKYDNFRVYIDNYYCDSEDGLSCPKSIIIFYKSAEVLLTRKLMNGVMTNVMYFNHKIVKPGFKKDGISFSTLGINMIVEIPEIGATITFSGLIFSVKLPYSKFGNNTEGQCGTCTNNKADECRLPNGEIISSCPQMAHHWIVDNNKSCHGVPIPPVVTTPPPKPHCETPPLCKLIWSKIFAECHAVIPPEPFFKGCVFDGCRIADESMQCSSLEIYATECAARGICIDWRGKTNNTCCKYCRTQNCVCEKWQYLVFYSLCIVCDIHTQSNLFLLSKTDCFSNFPQPGAVVPSGSCEECTCSESSHSTVSALLLSVIPTPLSSNIHQCPSGYKYTKKPGECCGTCKAAACIVTVGDITRVLQVTTPAIVPHNFWLYLIMGGRGSGISHIISDSFSFAGFAIRYSPEANMMEHKCSCCQEIKTSQRKVTLTCSDGTYLDHSYTYVEKCSCVSAECISQASTQQEINQIKTSQEQENLKSRKQTNPRKTVPLCFCSFLFALQKT
uniref:Uncharacterized protein n=1 Tax=Melopsittacus undulatus TaxID=13146 RepID=A0A8V5GMB9_MELUD